LLAVFEIDGTNHMTGLVRYAKEDDVAVITVDNPPVNALGPGVAEGIAAGLSRAVPSAVKRCCTQGLSSQEVSRALASMP
jgi:hypothetical protein